MKTLLYGLMALICIWLINITYIDSVAHAAQSRQHSNDLSYAYFDQIPVLENGRIKPLNAFARSHLKRFNGQENWRGLSASQWLAETLFNPADAANFKIFQIKDNTLKEHLSLNKEDNFFALADLMNGLSSTQEEVIKLIQTPEKDLTKNQKALITLHENVATYNELLRSFSFLLPLNIGLSPTLQDTLGVGRSNDTDKNTNYNFQTLLPHEQQILRDVKKTLQHKGQDPENYNEEEKTRALLSLQLQQIRDGGQNNNDLAIIPLTPITGNTTTNNQSKIEWIAPWQIFNEGKGSPFTAKTLKFWQNAVTAYRTNDAKTWKNATHDILHNTLAINGIETNQNRLKIENIYNTVKPYHIAMALYAISIIILILLSIKPIPALTYAAITTAASALILHCAGIASRIYILQRPPVGTLYESVLFVSLICSIIGFITLIKTKKPIIPLTAFISSLLLLSIAPVMLQSTDSLELLVAVLNTNFWLATHVLCITAGYGVCVIAACLSHAYMALRLQKAKQIVQHKKQSPNNKEWLESLFNTIHKITLIALFFTGLGTVLGGIWADQSWGRFWGWDPKENGALLIVLWIIWIQHGRLSGHLRPLAFIALSAALNIIVALSWFGVNLLGVGLHSYGFTSGLATGLAVFCTIEAIIILTLFICTRQSEKRNIKTDKQSQ